MFAALAGAARNEKAGPSEPASVSSTLIGRGQRRTHDHRSVLAPDGARAHLPTEGLVGNLLSYCGTVKADGEAGVDAWWNTLAFLKNVVDGRR